MGVLSILKSLSYEKNFLISIVFVGILFKSVYSTLPTSDDPVSVEKLSFCNENVINDRAGSKR